jgi:tetratricopeptide (TPR) repeat protein
MGKKSRQKQQPLQVRKETSATLSLLVFGALCLLLAYPAYFRGLYFSGELLFTHLFTCLLLILWWAVKYQRKDYFFVSTPLDYCFLGLAAVYLLSLLVAVNIRGAVEEFLKVSNFFLVYWLVKEVCVSRKQVQILLNVLLFSALGVALLGLGALAGTWEIAGGIRDGRIFSTLQYANSLAAYLTSTFFIAASLFYSAIPGWRKVYTGTALLLVVTALLTYSRGGWLVMSLFVPLFALLAAKLRRDAVIFTAVVLTVGMICAPLLGIVAEDGRSGLFWLIILAGVAVSLFLVDIPVSRRVVFPSLVILLALAVTVAGMHVRQKVAEPLRLVHPPDEAKTEKFWEERQRVVPETEYTLAAELLAAGAQEQPYGWRVRVFGVRADGNRVTLINERGMRKEAWESRTFTFKTPAGVSSLVVQLVNAYPGVDLQARNVYLAGAGEKVRLDFLWHRVLMHALYSRIVSFQVQDSAVQERLRFYRDAWAIVRDYPLLGLGGQGWQSRNFQYQSSAYLSKTVHNHFLQLWVDAGIGAVVFFLGITTSFALLCIKLIRQSLDNEQNMRVLALCFAFFSVAMHSLYDFNLSLGAIGIYVAAVLGLARSFVAVRKDGSPLVPGVNVAVAVLLLFISAALLLGNTEHQAGRRLLQEQRAGAALAHLERAASFDPLDAEIRLNLARVYEAIGRARADDGFIQKAAAQYERVLVLDRYHPRSSHMYGTFLIRNGQFNKGLDYLLQSLNLNPRFGRAYALYAKHCLDKALELHLAGQKDAARSYLDKIFPLEAKLSEYVPESLALSLSLGQAHFMLGNREQAGGYLREALAVDKDRAGAAMTLAALYRQLGERDKAREYFNKALYWDQNSAGVYQAFTRVR